MYYARQASIVYERSWRYQVDPKCGEGHWAFTQRAILQTPKGSCSIDFALRRAQSATPGGCHPEEYLGATAEVLPPSDTGEQFLGTQVYAGRTCKAFRSNQGGLLGDRCTYAPKGFSPYQADMGWSRPAGVNLLIHIYADGQEKPEDAIPYLAAQEVQEAIRVSRGVFLPHIAGGFRIMETGVK